jgi:ABC-type glycerol-3-phosphate transport system substrate-binding protein
MKRMFLVATLLFVTAALIFAGGRQQSGRTSSSGGTSDDPLKFKGTITMTAGVYEPREATATNPYTCTELFRIVERYHALHPDINIQFVEGGDGDAWLITRMAAGMAPDIFGMHYFNVNTVLSPNSYYKLNDFLERPNKYVAGNERWRDLFRPFLLEQIQGINGEINVINGDYTGTFVFYNVDMLNRAGVELPIRTWSEYTAACEKLKTAGFTPWAWSFGPSQEGEHYITWFSRLFGTNLYYDDFDKLAVISGKDALALSPLEVAIAVKNGYFTPSDPRWMAWWPLLKDHVDKYMPRDVTSVAITRQGVKNWFINGQMAMYWGNSGVNKDLMNAGVDFDFLTVNWPVPDKASLPLATDYYSAPAVGGPVGGFQFGISSPQANYSMNADKLEAVIDWLMYITTPENNEAICNDGNSYAPSIIGANPIDALAGVVELMDTKPKVIDIGPLSLGQAAASAYYRELQIYMSGDQSLQQAGANLVPVFNAAADEIISKAEINATPYLKR